MQSSRWATPSPNPPSKAPLSSPPPPTSVEPQKTLSPQPAVPATTSAAPSDPIPPPSAYEPLPSTDYPLDAFAQTRPPDDLFGDDFTPIAEPEIEYSQPTPSAEPSSASSQAPSSISSAPVRGRGPNRGAINHSHSGINNATPRGPRASASSANASSAATAALAAEPVPTPVSAQGTPAPAAPRHEAVRGDRSGTGGVKKVKLTEEELSARMEAIKLKNASLEAAHARAEEDEARFRETEKKAAEQRRVDRQNRQVMMGERERNRQRKLGAMGGREWDASKDEADKREERGGHGGYRRGAHGGVVGAGGARGRDKAVEMDIEGAGRTNGDGEDGEGRREGGYSTTGRGGRGGRGGGSGRGRGARAAGAPESGGGRKREGESGQRQNVPTADDFPALAPAAEKPAAQLNTGGTDGAVAAVAANKAAAAAGKSWADEMDSPVVEGNE